MSTGKSTFRFGVGGQRAALAALLTLLLGCLPLVGGLAAASALPSHEGDDHWFAPVDVDQPAKPEVGRPLRGGKPAIVPSPAPPADFVPAIHSAAAPPGASAVGFIPIGRSPPRAAAHWRPSPTGPPSRG